MGMNPPGATIHSVVMWMAHQTEKQDEEYWGSRQMHGIQRIRWGGTKEVNGEGGSPIHGWIQRTLSDDGWLSE